MPTVSWEELYALCQPYAYKYNPASDPAVSNEDVVQGALELIYRYHDGTSEGVTADLPLIRVWVQHCMYDTLRNNSYKLTGLHNSTKSLTHVDAEDDSTFQTQVRDRDMTPEQYAVFKSELARVLGKLTPSQRDAILLAAAGFEPVKIAEIMGITVSSTTGVLYRGRKAIGASTRRTARR